MMGVDLATVRRYRRPSLLLAALVLGIAAVAVGGWGSALGPWLTVATVAFLLAGLLSRSRAHPDLPPPSTRPAPATPPATTRAFLVAHGVGQQRRFQVLDSFAHGIAKLLEEDGYGVAVEHFMRSRDATIEHGVRLTATGTERATRRFDLYEYYWAPLTQGRAKFLDIVGWVRATALTPLRRLAFNLPLVARQAEADGSASLKWHFASEIARIALVFLAFMGIAGLVTWIVDTSPQAAKRLASAAGRVSGGTMWDWMTLAVITAFGVALVALLGSLGPQIVELARLSRRHRASTDPALGRAMFAAKLALLGPVAAGVGDRGGTSSGLTQGLRARGKLRSQPTDSVFRRALDTWKPTESVGIQARLGFLRYSIIGIVLCAAVLGWLVTLEQPALRGVLTPVITTKVLNGNAWRTFFAALFKDLGGPLVLVAAAFVVKRVFVDYVGDVALYATADENSLFFRTRLEILTGAAEKIRWLLRQPEYDEVALAGHSLGSVIVYDALSAVRVETQVLPPPGPEGPALGRLAALLATKLGAVADAEFERVRAATEERYRFSGDDVRSLGRDLVRTHSEALVGAVDELNGLFTELAAAQDRRRDGRASTAPLAPAEYARIRTLITFGCPLNKVVYFFRTQVAGYETVRAHILRDLHGFRRLVDTDADDVQHPGFEPPDEIFWLNVAARLDPISSDLRFFDVNARRWRWYTHTQYWHDPLFYRWVLQALEREV